MRLLIVVDMQRDFIDGVLGTKEAQAVVVPAAKKIACWEGDVICTRDTHHGFRRVRCFCGKGERVIYI